MDYDTARVAVENFKGSTFIGIDTTTTVKLKGGKKNPMQGRVEKHVVGSNTMIFTNSTTNAYENMVRKRLQEEGKDPESFELKPRAWGHRIPDTPFVEHNGKHYMEVIFMHPGDVYYTLDGEMVDKEDIEGLDSPETKQDDKGQGGLENKVQIRTYALDSIKTLRMDGKVYE